MPQFDDRDQAILDARQAAYLDRVERPQVGHWVRFADDTLRRISHVWDWPDAKPSEITIQTAIGGSFYLGLGYMTFSGALYPGVPAHTFRPTDYERPGSAWFFHHNDACAHNGVNVELACPVWDCSRPANF